MTLDEMIDNEIKKMRREPRVQPQPVREVPEGQAIDRMVRAAMPAVIRDSKARRADIAKLRKAEQQQDKATSVFVQKNPPADGEAIYEQADPNFL